MHRESWIQRLESAAAQGLRRALPVPGPAAGGTLDCGSNDYLGLSRHPRVIAAAHAALDRDGAGATASRLLRGNREIHEQLEQEIARLKGTEAALVFASGYSANLGLLSALGRADDVILCDKLDHASLVDGARLARASVRFYAHGDAAHLDRQLGRSTGNSAKFVATDGVFSMDGTLAPLPDLLEVCDRHGALLIVDDAHATGCVGPGGAGSVAHFGLDPGRMIQVGTLSKAIGAQGGFVAASKVLIDLLVQFSRAFIYSTGLNPPAAAAAMEALRVSREEPWHRERLQENLGRMRDGLLEAGHRIYGESPAPMCALHVGEADAAVALAEGSRSAV